MKYTRFAKLIVLFCSTIVFVHSAVSQTDDSGTAPPKTVRKRPAPKDQRSPNKGTRKSTTRAQSKRGPQNTSRVGVISIVVNESDTEIFLDGPNGDSVLDEGSVIVSPGTSRVIGNLQPGTYKLTARKPGYSETTRSITVVAGKTNPVEIRMRSAMNFLTVTTNVDDATIEIDGVGHYQGAVRNLPLTPGVYIVKVTRLGYIPQSKSVTLADPPSSSIQEIRLQPVPIDSMLADASRKIAAGDYQDALAIAEEVLAIDAAHGGANYTAGSACFAMGDARSSDFFLRSIRAGHTISLPASVLIKANNGSAIVKITLMLDRNYLYIRGESRPDQNFTLFKPDVERMALKLDRASQPFLEIEGKGEANGRRDDRELAIYSQLTLLRPNRKETFCSTRAGGQTCSTDMTAIHRLISDWQHRLR